METKIFKKTNSNDQDFKKLYRELDSLLRDTYPITQDDYAPHNKLEFIETVLVIYLENIPAACGCFKAYDNRTVEIKRMFVREAFRGKGLSKELLKELENWALDLNFSQSILETGTKQKAAIGLYINSGYKKIENYGPYKDLPSSICFLKYL